jgi:hypothetical protein
MHQANTHTYTSILAKSILDGVHADQRYEPTEEAKWQTDLQKCQDSKALFQRTIMMGLIDRHGLDPKLHYTCEVQWTSGRMPARHPQVRISQPRPDLAVAFKSSALIPGGSLTEGA